MNKKRVRRLYRLDGLQLRMRVRRRKHIALHRGPAPVPAGPTERWSMDFVHDALADGRPFRVLTVADQWSRQSPILEVASSLSGATVGQALDRVLPAAHGLLSITVDHGTEFMSRALEDWAYQRGVQLDFIRPGKPVENAFIESFNSRLRDECLNVHQFTSIEDAKTKIEAWRVDYNQRPVQIRAAPPTSETRSKIALPHSASPPGDLSGRIGQLTRRVGWRMVPAVRTDIRTTPASRQWERRAA